MSTTADISCADPPSLMDIVIPDNNFIPVNEGATTAQVRRYPDAGEAQETYRNKTKQKGTAEAANARRRIKERKIKQLLSLEDLFRDERKYPVYYVITFPGVEIDSEINVISADREIKGKIGEYRKATKLNKDSLLIEVCSEQQAKALMRVKSVGNKTVTVQPHRTMNTVKGTVLSDAMSQSSIQEITEQLAPQGVTKVERMKMKEDGVLKDSNRYILTFNRVKLPSLIKLAGWAHEIVDLYIPTPLRCTKCQVLGHTKNWCSKTIDVCVRCGGQGHYSRGCELPPHCVNCGGDHPSSSRECDHYKFKCEVIATQTRNNITYHEAVHEVRTRFRDQGKTYSFAVSGRRSQATGSNPPAAAEVRAAADEVHTTAAGVHTVTAEVHTAAAVQSDALADAHNKTATDLSETTTNPNVITPEPKVITPDPSRTTTTVHYETSTDQNVTTADPGVTIADPSVITTNQSLTTTNSSAPSVIRTNPSPTIANLNVPSTISAESNLSDAGASTADAQPSVPDHEPSSAAPPNMSDANPSASTSTRPSSLATAMLPVPPKRPSAIPIAEKNARRNVSKDVEDCPPTEEKKTERTYSFSKKRLSNKSENKTSPQQENKTPSHKEEKHSSQEKKMSTRQEKGKSQSNLKNIKTTSMVALADDYGSMDEDDTAVQRPGKRSMQDSPPSSSSSKRPYQNSEKMKETPPTNTTPKYGKIPVLDSSYARHSYPARDASMAGGSRSRNPTNKQ